MKSRDKKELGTAVVVVVLVIFVVIIALWVRHYTLPRCNDPNLWETCRDDGVCECRGDYRDV